jgi:thioredoxin-dependent peroxiredoxin
MAAEKRARAKAGKTAAVGAPASRGKSVEATAKKAPTKRTPTAARKKAGTGAAKLSAGRVPAAPDKPANAAKPAKPAKPSKPASAQASAATLGEGDAAPSFSLHDQRGQTLSSDELAGKPYVVYFYPKDDTPGCTTQACGFRDTGAEFDEVGVRVIGVSPDSVASHQRFATKYGLPFTLLSDPEQALASEYGVWALKKNYGREYMGIVRSTFLVDGSGVIRKVWRGVRVNGHVAEVQAAAAALS